MSGRPKLSVLRFGEDRCWQARVRAVAATICEWETLEYGPGKQRKTDQLVACLEKSRSAGLVCAFVGDEIVAYSDVWSLETEFYERLKRGIEPEETLEPDCIRSSFASHEPNYYVGSVIVSPRLRSAQPARSAVIFREITAGIGALLKQHAAFPARMLGVGFSPLGEKLLRHFGFTPVSRAADAVDHRPRFEKCMLAAANADCFMLANAG